VHLTKAYHALLDGELIPQVREIQAHWRLFGVRHPLQSVWDICRIHRLVGAIQFPGTPRRPAALDPALEPEREAPPIAPAADAARIDQALNMSRQRRSTSAQGVRAPPSARAPTAPSAGLIRSRSTTSRRPCCSCPMTTAARRLRVLTA
jgi:hypothetical protein